MADVATWPCSSVVAARLSSSWRQGHVTWKVLVSRGRPSSGRNRACVPLVPATSAVEASMVVAIRNARQMLLSPSAWSSFVAGAAPVALAVTVSIMLKTGLEEDIKVAVARSTAQLLILSSSLKYMLDGDRRVLSALSVLAMVLVAGHIVGERASKFPKSHLVGVVSLTLGSLFPVACTVALHVFPRSVGFVVPAVAHFLGMAMIMVGMTLDTLHHEVSTHEKQIEVALALGATPQQAIQPYVKRALALGLAPQLDALKTMGLVSMPGVMTGMILGGTPPLDAVQLQIQMLNVGLGTSVLSCIIAGIVGSQLLFSRTLQLLPLQT